jgi:membrane-associated phospholipid phosphatase
MNFNDLISLSTGILYIIPVILYNITKNTIHIKSLIGLIGTVLFSESIKYYLVGNKSKRPDGALNCNLLCNDGDQQGKPGMPSSHSATVAFFSGFYIQNTTNWVLQTLLVIYAILVMMSRYLKRCHTINQIVTGAILGLSLSWLTVRHL